MQRLKQIKAFCLESNRIEGEDRINPGDLEAVEYALVTSDLCLGCIFELHRIVGAYLKEPWVGKFREVQVAIGGYVPPPPHAIPEAMDLYLQRLPHMNSWEAHNEFEKIHCFRDLNGRVGRLIWLSKAVNEGYTFKIPFLQAYYYQTLARYEQR